MAKNPKDQFEHSKPLPPPIESGDGPIPWENWDNDQRFTGDVDKGPGSVYDSMFGPKSGVVRPGDRNKK